MNKRVIIAIIIAVFLLASAGVVYALLNQKPADDIPDKKEQYERTDPDTGESYTVNGVTSNEKFDKPWIYGQYSLKQAGLSQAHTDAFSAQLSQYISDTYKKKYEGAEILTPYITVVNPGKEYALKIRLGQVSDTNVYLYATLSVETDSSLHIVLKDESSVVKEVIVK